MQQPKSNLPIVGQVLKDYRKANNLSQEELAYELHIEPRTLRAYENGERALNNIHELRRIADLLGIEPEILGLASSIYPLRSPEQIEEVVQHVWNIVDASRIREARNTIERLVQNIQPQVSTGNPELLLSLAHAHHAAGYIVSEGTRANESYLSIRHYEQMESIARTLNDHTLLNIALTYIGDMYRRLGKIEKAISYLEAARDTTPLADDAARGNGIQLLGRAYLQQNDINKFERAMAEAEELAFTFDPATSSTRGHYSVGTVYEEYGRAYTKLGQINKAMEYLDKADATLPKTKFWELLVKTARTLTIIQAGDIRSGVQLAIEAAGECRATGNLRYLERIYCVQQYLEDMMRDLDKISRPLRETLDEGRTTELEWRRM